MASKSFYEKATSQPWKSEDNREAAEWLKDNEPAFTAIIDASKKLKLYIPLVLAKPDDPLTALAPTDVSLIREAAGAMMVCADMAIGDGHTSEAWPDITAAYRLGALLAQQHSAVQREVGLDIISMSLTTAQNAVTSPKLPRGQARAKLSALLSPQFPAISDATPVIDLARYTTLDAIARLAQQMPRTAGNLPKAEEVVRAARISQNEAQTPVMAKVFAALAFEDWVDILGAVNDRYDKLAKALALPTYGQQVAALKTINEETAAIQAKLRRLKPQEDDQQVSMANWAKTYWLSVPLPTQRPGIGNAQAVTMKELLTVALAVEACKSDKGKYPGGLNELLTPSTIGTGKTTEKIPAYLKSMPMDFFTEKSDKPFQYKIIEGGYILYSVRPEYEG